MMTSPSSSPKSDFSIEHILKRAGIKKSPPVSPEKPTELSWLQCTRYCPPKLPRSQKKEGPQKRQLGRHPRIPFSSHQLAILEEKFKHSPYLSSSEVTQLSKTLQLADVRVKIWFQNRRARERRERNEGTNQMKVTPPPINLPEVPYTTIATPTNGSPGFVSYPHHINAAMETMHKLDFRNITCFLNNETRP